MCMKCGIVSLLQLGYLAVYMKYQPFNTVWIVVQYRNKAKFLKGLNSSILP